MSENKLKLKRERQRKAEERGRKRVGRRVSQWSNHTWEGGADKHRADITWARCALQQTTPSSVNGRALSPTTTTVPSDAIRALVRALNAYTCDSLTIAR